MFKKLGVFVMAMLISGIVYGINYPVTSVRDTDGDQLLINSDGSINATVNPTIKSSVTIQGDLGVTGNFTLPATFSSSVTVKSNLGATNNIIVAQDMTSNFVNASSMTITRNVAGVTGLFINNNSADAAARVGVYLTDGSVLAGRFQYAKFYNNINFDSLVSGNNFGISTLGSATKITLSPNGVAELDAYAGRVEIPHTLSATNIVCSGTSTVSSFPIRFLSSDTAAGCVVWEDTVTIRTECPIILSNSCLISNDVSGSVCVGFSSATVGGVFVQVSTGDTMTSGTYSAITSPSYWTKTVFPAGALLRFYLTGATPVSVQNVTYQLNYMK